MEIPEEMQRKIDANSREISLLIEEIQMLASEQNHLLTISEEINKWLEDKNDFSRSPYWSDKCESYVDQAEALGVEMRKKAGELNELSGGFLDLWRDQDTEGEVLSEIVQIIDSGTAH